MRLLNAHSLQLESFPGPSTSAPPYAILSHTWHGDDEVSLQDLTSLSSSSSSTKPGFRKIRWCAAQSLADGLTHCWVDTCCIDKTSSAELGEAVNSMFRWYRDAAVCYVYLADVSASPAEELGHRVSSSRWFKRGWTLQELLAPRHRFFFDAEWEFIGKIMPEDEALVEAGQPPTPTRFRSRLMDVVDMDMFPLSIALDQHIPLDLLCHRTSLDDYCVAEKMGYAFDRATTRPEDRAYSLFGLFNVNMPLVYGEGGDKAFLRLQEEIIKQDVDHSIFQWMADRNHTPLSSYRGLLARDPDEFGSFRTTRVRSEPHYPHIHPYSMTNRGLKIRLPMLPTGGLPDEYIAGLNCKNDMGDDTPSFITLAQVGPHDQFARVDHQHASLEAYPDLKQRFQSPDAVRQIFIRQNPAVPGDYNSARVETWVMQPAPKALQLYLHEVLPGDEWNAQRRTLRMEKHHFEPLCRGLREGRVVFSSPGAYFYAVRIRAGASIQGGSDYKLAKIAAAKYRTANPGSESMSDDSKSESETDDENLEWCDTVEYTPPQTHDDDTSSITVNNDTQTRGRIHHPIDETAITLGLETTSKIVDDLFTKLVKIVVVNNEPQPRGVHFMLPHLFDPRDRPDLVSRRTF